MIDRFRHFAAIDWSGAASERHRGIAVALCGAGSAAPALVRPGHRWSRAEVLRWMLQDMPGDTLVPLYLALSMTLLTLGLALLNWWVVAVGVGCTAASILAWLWPEAALGETAEVRHE